MEQLPVIESSDDVKIRTAEEIAKRAIACLISIQAAFELHSDIDAEEKKSAKNFIEGLLTNFGVENELTPKEKDIIFKEEVSEQEKIDMAWKYEGYWVLIWALGLVDELSYPEGICDCNYATKVVAEHGSFDSFMTTVKLRDIHEILDECDLIYRYDWACVDAHIKGEEAPSDLDSGVVLERHRALNWLIDADESDDWDNVSADT